MERIAYPSLLALTLALTACGGGSDAGTTSQSSQAPVVAMAATTEVAPVLTSATTTVTPSAAQTCGLANFQQALLNRVNQARANSRMCGSKFFNAVGPVQWNAKLFNAAAGHSADMAGKNFFSHTSSNGTQPGARLHNAGYNWNTYGENIAAGYQTVDSVMTGWLNSPGHCENLMQPNFTEVGASCVSNASSTYRMYWTMDLGRQF